MRTSLAFASLLLLLLGLPATAHGATIRGTVRDTNGSPGRPVANASVLVWQHGGGFQTTVTTGPDGFFEARAPHGVYNVCANKADQPAYRSDLETVERVNVILSGTVVVNFDLPARAGYAAQLLATSAPAALAAGQVATVQLRFRNQGLNGWDASTRLAISNARFAEPGRDGSSALEGPGWLAKNRVLAVGSVAPGAEQTVTFSIRGPAQPGGYVLYLELVQEGVAWFEGHGDDVTLSVSVSASSTLVGLDAHGAAHSAILAAYNALGAGATVGAPADNGGGDHVHVWGSGWIQDFRGGSGGDGALLYRAGEARARWVHGAVWAAYLGAGGAEGPLGLPTADEANGVQAFEHGTIERQPNGAWLVKGVFVPPVALGRVAIDGNQIFAADGSVAIDGDALAATGARTVRVNFIGRPWSGPTDTTLHAGRTWAQAADQVVNGLRARGIAVYGLLNDELIGGGDFLRDQSDPGTARAWVEKFADACVAVVGQLKDRVNVFEVINEPNDWAGQTRARVAPYWQALILKRVYEKVKLDHAGDPSWQVTLVSGPVLSLAGVNGDDFVAAVYREGRAHHDWDGVRARAGRFPLDGVGLHIYDVQDPNDAPASVGASFRQHLDAISGAVAAADPEAGAKKIWVSEFGWQSDQGGERHQADMLQAGLDALVGDGRVACAISFCAFDWPGSTWGIYDTSKKRKAAFDAFKANAAR